MTTTANRYFPKRLDAHQFARNAFIPEAHLVGHLADAVNHIQAYRRKSFFSRGMVSTPPTGAAGTTTVARFRCHVGYGASYIAVHLGLGLCDTVIGTPVDPLINVNCKIAGGGTTTVSTHYGLNAGGVITDAPDEIAYRTVRVPITAGETYEVSIDAVDYARILTVSAYEEADDQVDTTSGYYVDPAHGAVGYPIYDATRKGILQGLSQLWRRNGPQLLTWPGDLPASLGGPGAPTNATTTWKNAIDDTTAVAASSAAWNLGDSTHTLETLCRLSDGKALDIVLAAHLSCTGSATGEVRLQDGSRTLCSLTGAGTASAWYTTTTTITSTDTLARCDAQFRTSNGANTVTLNAISVYAFLT